MSPAVPASPGPPDPPPEGVEVYRRALEAMPLETVATVMARIAAGVAHAERTGEFAPVRHVLDSLAMTARLQGNQAYLAAVAEADAVEARGDLKPVDIAKMVARMRKKKRGR